MELYHLFRLHPFFVSCYSLFFLFPWAGQGREGIESKEPVHEVGFFRCGLNNSCPWRASVSVTMYSIGKGVSRVLEGGLPQNSGIAKPDARK